MSLKVGMTDMRSSELRNTKQELEKLRRLRDKAETKIKDLESKVRNAKNPLDFPVDLQRDIGEQFFELYDFMQENLTDVETGRIEKDVELNGIVFQIVGWVRHDEGEFILDQVAIPVQPNETPREKIFREMMMAQDPWTIPDYFTDNGGCQEFQDLAKTLYGKVEDFMEFVEDTERIPHDTAEYFYDLFRGSNCRDPHVKLVIKDAPAWFRPFIRAHKKNRKTA